MVPRTKEVSYHLKKRIYLCLGGACEGATETETEAEAERESESSRERVRERTVFLVPVIFLEKFLRS